MKFTRGKNHGWDRAATLAIALTAMLSLTARAEAPTESPITRIEAEFMCALGDGNERVAFSRAAPGQNPRVWLGLADSDYGLEAEVTSFTYRACEGCFAISGRYRFSGGLNLLHFETVADEPSAQFPPGEWPPRRPDATINPDEDEPIELPPPPQGLNRRPRSFLQDVDCDLPPGMELPPECQDDRPPGSDPLPPEDPTPTPTPTPDDPVVPAGPPLKIRYYETDASGDRTLYQGTGLCLPTTP